MADKNYWTGWSWFWFGLALLATPFFLMSLVTRQPPFDHPWQSFLFAWVCFTAEMLRRRQWFYVSMVSMTIGCGIMGWLLWMNHTTWHLNDEFDAIVGAGFTGFGFTVSALIPELTRRFRVWRAQLPLLQPDLDLDLGASVPNEESSTH